MLLEKFQVSEFTYQLKLRDFRGGTREKKYPIVLHPQAVLHVVTLEQTGLLTLEAAENALQSLRNALQTPQEIPKEMINDPVDDQKQLYSSDHLVQINEKDDITVDKDKGMVMSNVESTTEWVVSGICQKEKQTHNRHMPPNPLLWPIMAL